MLVSYKWLKELVDVDVLSEELAEKMSTTGIEVEGVSSPAEGLSNIVVGEVVSCEDVPETHLHVCQVNVGEEVLRQIVCGAPNVRAGIKVIVALPGARIVDNYKIKKGKIRGLESLGMICSLGELGISDSIVPKEFSEGIQILPEEAVPGDLVFPYLDLDDEIIELSITPNRADALSMRGVAYEVAAIYDKPIHFQDFPLLETDRQAAEQLSVAIETEKAPFYAVRILENVTITPSPQWLQNLLMNEGIRPINNVVDVTNYMLLYFGQPMHAFDLDTFEDNQIVVREARAGEKLVTLDDEERDLIINRSAEGILAKGSLRQIYNYFHMFADKVVPVTIEELIKTKSIDDIIDCGKIFSVETDKWLTLLEDILYIIKNNCNSKGDFITDSAPDGKRGYFLGQFIYNLRGTDAVNTFISQLSSHDRIILSQSRYFGFDLATKDDIKKELLDIGVNGDASGILQRLRYCSHAIVDIITSTPCLTKSNISEKILWLRKYYSIKEREYRNIAERLDAERKLLAYWSEVQSAFGFDVAPHGIDLKKMQVALSYADYKKHSNFLSVIWKATIIDHTNFIVEFKKEDLHDIDKNDISLIERIVGNHFEENGKCVRIELAKSSDYSVNTVLSYITVNVLNNLSIEIEQEEIDIISNQRIVSYISSIINMTAKDYMEASWRVGDRGDLETYYKDIVIEFEEVPNKLVRSILMEIVPDLTNHNESKVFEYHYSKSEIASGYGRSWSWENNDDYKNSMLVDLIIRIFESFKEGLFIDLEFQPKILGI